MTKAVSIGRISLLAMILAAAASACSKADKGSVADTLDSIDTVKPLAPTTADSARLDSSGVQRAVPPPPPPRGALPPPGGETYRRGGTMAPRDPAPPNDPPVKIIGETRREGSSTMSPTTPRPRDSTVGPRLQMDSRGNVTPIRR